MSISTIDCENIHIFYFFFIQIISVILTILIKKEVIWETFKIYLI